MSLLPAISEPPPATLGQGTCRCHLVQRFLLLIGLLQLLLRARIARIVVHRLLCVNDISVSFAQPVFISTPHLWRLLRNLADHLLIVAVKLN